MLSLIVLLGCLSRCGEEPSAPPAPPVQAPPTAPVVGDPGSVAPTREVWGLEIGASNAEQVDAWLAQRGLSCASAPAPRRTTVHWTCKGPINLSIFPDRVIAGQIDELMLARLDEGPLHHLSLERIYSIPEQAADDLSATLAAISSALGPPQRQLPLPADVNWGSPVVHADAQWRFDDLEVRLSLLKVGKSPIRVSERWSEPGAEARAEARPGSAPMHEEPPKRGRNPHEKKPR